MRTFFLKSLGYAAGLLLTLGLHPLMAQTQEQFDACVQRTGKDYRKARDQFLAAGADAKLLTDKLKSASWRDRLTAQILLGWKAHAAEYRQLLAAPKVLNQLGEAHYPWAQNPETLKPSAVPLLYELLMKDGETRETAWDAAAGLTALAQGAGAVDVALLHDFLRAGEAPNPEARIAAAWVIASLPGKLLKADELMKSLEAESNRAQKDPAVAKSLMQALTVAARTNSLEDKDRLVEAVRNLAGLRTVMDADSITYTVGGIGGNQAARVVADYLEAAREPSEKGWALDTLGRIGTPTAARTLLKYAQERELSPRLKSAALQGLSRCEYSNEIGSRLGDIIKDTSKPEWERLEAIRSLERLHRSNVKNRAAEESIRSRFKEISGTDLENEAVKREFSKSYRGIDKRPEP